MNNEKFLSYFSKFVLGLCLIGFCYCMFKVKDIKDVKDYPIAKGLTYTGKLKNGMCYGSGILKGKDFTYKGSFEDGRFKGAGEYVGKDFTYTADFNKEELSDNIHIKLEDGLKFKKKNNKWVKE